MTSVEQLWETAIKPQLDDIKTDLYNMDKKNSDEHGELVETIKRIQYGNGSKGLVQINNDIKSINERNEKIDKKKASNSAKIFSVLLICFNVFLVSSVAYTITKYNSNKKKENETKILHSRNTIYKTANTFK